MTRCYLLLKALLGIWLPLPLRGELLAGRLRFAP